MCGSWVGSRCLEAVLHPAGQFLTVVFFLGLLGLSIYGCTLVTSQVDVDELDVPRGANEAARAFHARDRLFLLSNRVQPLVHVYSVEPGVDYFASMTSLDNLATQLVCKPSGAGNGRWSKKRHCGVGCICCA